MTPTAQELINELAMSTSFRAHVVVEGISDQKLLQNTLPKNLAANVIPAGNCEAALNVAEAFQEHPAKSTLKLVVFVDRDYQVALRNIDKIPNVVVTELRDIECMMFDSECFDRVIEEYVSDSKLAALQENHISIKNFVISLAAEIGCIRYASQKEKWGISFKALDFEKFLIKKGMIVDRAKFIGHINGAQTAEESTTERKEKKRLSADDYSNALEITNNCAALQHPLLRARGHDLVAILHFGLRKCWGNKVATDLTPEILEKTFHIAYPEKFVKTTTFGIICNAL